MWLLSFRVQFLQLLLIYRCWDKFCTEELENACRKLLNWGNKHSVFIPIAAIFNRERNLIGADFDHVLGNHFWAMSVHAINKSRLWIVIFVKFHLNTWLPLDLNPYLFFSKSLSKIKSANGLLGSFARRARKERKLLARRENLLVPDDRMGFFLALTKLSLNEFSLY